MGGLLWGRRVGRTGGRMRRRGATGGRMRRRPRRVVMQRMRGPRLETGVSCWCCCLGTVFGWPVGPAALVCGAPSAPGELGCTLTHTPPQPPTPPTPPLNHPRRHALPSPHPTTPPARSPRTRRRHPPPQRLWPWVRPPPQRAPRRAALPFDLCPRGAVRGGCSFSVAPLCSPPARFLPP